MSNKIELKKTIFVSSVVIILVSIIFGIFQYYQYNMYVKNLNNEIASVITKVKERYPEVNDNDLIQIINGEADINEDLFSKYGIDVSKDSVIIENDKCFNKFLVTNLLILICLAILVAILFLRYNYFKDKKLSEITKYIEEVNNKNYKLDIDDNTEDELSILKNEIYKTTITLKEVAENSLNDKILFKDSLSNISHQLKTPLTSISILLDNILDDPDMDSSTRDDFIKDIKRETININFLVHSLLKLSKLDANSVNFINKENRVKDMLDEAIKNISVLSDLKNIDIIVNCDIDTFVYCDFKWQVEAISNIIKNCLEYSEVGSKIDIFCEDNKLYTKIDIKDYGVGIEAQDLPHIFERFYKGKSSSSDSVGIGLALSKSIIESNNGYISVESEIGEGTVFTIKYFK